MASLHRRRTINAIARRPASNSDSSKADAAEHLAAPEVKLAPAPWLSPARRNPIHFQPLSVTPGGLSGSSGGTEGSDPISASEVGSGVLGAVGRLGSTLSAVKAA